MAIRMMNRASMRVRPVNGTARLRSRFQPAPTPGTPVVSRETTARRVGAPRGDPVGRRF
jgi:hypothetical protein